MMSQQKETQKSGKFGKSEKILFAKLFYRQNCVNFKELNFHG